MQSYEITQKLQNWAKFGEKHPKATKEKYQFWVSNMIA